MKPTPEEQLAEIDALLDRIHIPPGPTVQRVQVLTSYLQQLSTLVQQGIKLLGGIKV